MLAIIQDWPPLLSGTLGSLVAGLCTGVGALAIFLGAAAGAQQRQMYLLAVAAGIMLGATIFSLILPAMNLLEEGGSSAAVAAGGAGIGILMGAAAIWALHSWIPHEHFVKGKEGGAGVITAPLGRQWLFVLAITLHNFPEGVSVGVAFGTEDVRNGIAIMIGIGLQNMPEGLAVAAALVAEGFSRRRAFVVALLTGMVEPIGGALGAAAVSFSDALLPWALAGAAGAMLYVISGEVIPETHRKGTEARATMTLVLGFVVMMVLDVALG